MMGDRNMHGAAASSGRTARALSFVAAVAIVGSLFWGVYASPGARAEGSSCVDVTAYHLIRLMYALRLYQRDTGRFPTTDEGLEALLYRPTGPTGGGWAGPYCCKDDLSDQWGHPFQYRSPGQRFALYGSRDPLPSLQWTGWSTGRVVLLVCVCAVLLATAFWLAIGGKRRWRRDAVKRQLLWLAPVAAALLAGGYLVVSPREFSASRPDMASSCYDRRLCRWMRAGLSQELYDYKFQNGFYPTTEQGLAALLKKPTTAPIPQDWRGPYCDPVHLLDPWGKPLIYRQSSEYDLWSLGASVDDPADDYVSWEFLHARPATHK